MTGPDNTTDAPRRAALEAAQAKAFALLEAVEQAELIAPGRSERDVEDDIGRIAAAHFGVAKHWHRRLVRAGANTLATASDHPPVRVIDEDDLVYLDLGPVFEAQGEGWEADVGRSYVIGADPVRLRLVADLPRVFAEVQSHYRAAPDITGAALYDVVVATAEKAGWRFGGKIAGHIVSEFAHAHLPGSKDVNRIDPRNTQPMSTPDGFGRPRYWILEIHLVEPDGAFAGFCEQLL